MVLSRRSWLSLAGASLLASGARAQTAVIAGLESPRGLTRFRQGLVSTEALARAQAISDRFDGASLLVWRAGQMAYESYATGLSAASPLTTYSMAKSVLGLVYGLALRDGVISSLDTPVSDHLDEWRDDPRGAITLRQLLQMRSGLKLFSLAQKDSRALALLSGSNVTQTALATPLERAPGTMFEYANVNSQLAGTALDRALKRQGLGGYHPYMSRRLWRPLGQSTATQGVEFVGGEPRFFANLDATARDWLRLGVLFADHGRFEGRRIVPAGWIDEMTKPSVNPNYGLQIWRGSPWTAQRAYGPNAPQTVACAAPYRAPDMVFFDGAGGQRVYVSAALRLVIVRTGKASWTWEDSALPNTIIDGLA
jgi:CubicO group peptidase (beta-lactamase class C family)